MVQQDAGTQTAGLAFGGNPSAPPGFTMQQKNTMVLLGQEAEI
jgi:hypothetical protein